MLRNPFSSSISRLSLVEAVKAADDCLEMARNESDPQKALQLASEVKSKIQEAEKIFATERTGSPALDDGIATVYHEYGKLLDRLRSHDDAQESYNNAKKWGYIHVVSRQIYPSLFGDMSGSNQSIGYLASLIAIPSLLIATPGRNTTQPTHNGLTQEALPSHIFDKDVTPPFDKCTLPEIGKRISSTPQLAYCLKLLQSPPSLKEIFNEAERGWIHAATKDPNEQVRLQEMASDLIRAFIRGELKSRDAINEIICLAPVLDQEDFRKLLQFIIDDISNSTLLKVDMFDGLVHLLRNSRSRDFDVNDSVKILELLSASLQGIDGQPTQRIYKLTLAVSGILDKMADNDTKGLSREQLYDPLFKYLEGLQSRSEPYLMYQAAYAFQALQYVPDDESRSQSIQRSTRDLLQGAMSVMNGVKSFDFSILMEELNRIHQTKAKVTKPFIFNMKTNSGIGKNLRKNLKDGFSFKKDWYLALRALDIMLEDGQLSQFKMLVCKAPCRLEPVFQLGVCQRLGELAINPAWDAVSRQSAVDFLGEIYKNDVQWGRHDSVKRWILHILHQLRDLSESVIHEKVQTLVQDLETNGDHKKQPHYQERAKDLPGSYPLMIRLSSKASPLLDNLQNSPNVEAAISRLRRQRLMDQDGELYIMPLAKRNLHAKDVFDLTFDVQEFLKSDKKVFLLLGDSGAGKSTFNRALETRLWKSYHRDTNRDIPIFIHLPSITNPEQDLIAKQLRKVDFTEEQIRELKSQRKIILFCDGYDECQQTTNLYKSNQLNEPGEWDVQMVISCRTEYTSMDYKDQFQPFDQINCQVSNLYQEAVITPFNKDQIQRYIDQYVSMSKSTTTSWGAEEYKKTLEDIPNLQELLTNPFLLEMAMEVLPQFVDLRKDFSSHGINRLALYDAFVAQWIERKKLALMVTALTFRDKKALNTMTASRFMEYSINYLKELATGVYDSHGGNPVIDNLDYHDGRIWKESFFNDIQGKNLLRGVTPIVRDGSQYRFIHKSVLEYGLALAIYDPNIQNQVMKSMSAPSRSFKSSSLKERMATADEQSLLDSPLGKRNLVGEQPILQFLTERAQQEPIFKDQLHSVIERSKSDKTAGIAAANAITILVRAGVQFNGADLRNVKIQGADLSFGVFDSAQLQGADLWKVNLRNTWMRQVNLKGAQMTGVQFGELPFLQDDSSVVCCAYSPDGKILGVGLDNGDISLYETSSWDRIQTLSGHSSGVTSLSFSVTSNRIASGSTDGIVQLWDVDTGECVRTLRGHIVNSTTQLLDTGEYTSRSHTVEVRSVAYSPKGDCIAAVGDDSTVQLWDVDTGECVQNLYGHGQAVNSVVYSPKGNRIASGSSDSTVRLWDVDTGECVNIMQGHDRAVNSVVYSPKGDWIASGSDDKTVRLWDVDTGEWVRTLQGHSGLVRSIVSSPKGDKIASGGDDKTVRLWDVDTGECVQTLQGHSDCVHCVVYSPKGDLIVSGSKDKTVRLWDIDTCERVYISQRHGRSIISVANSPKGDRIASGSFDKRLQLWNVDTGECIRTLQGHSGNVRSVVYSPKGDRIASGSDDRTVRLWDTDTGECVCTMKGHNRGVKSVVYSPKGDQIASGSYDKTIRLWDVDTGECVRTLQGHTGSVRGVVYSPKGDRIVSGSDDMTVRLWDVDTGECIHAMQGHSSYVFSVMYSPKRDQIASGSKDKTVRIWDVDTCECVHTLQGHSDWICSVAYSPEGDRIASGSKDKSVRLWDVDTGECLATILGFSSLVSSVAWGNNVGAQYLVTGSWDKSVRRWRIIKEGAEHKAVLCWSSSHGALTVNNLLFEDVQGLSQLNQKLLIQRGALIPKALS